MLPDFLWKVNIFHGLPADAFRGVPFTQQLIWVQYYPLIPITILLPPLFHTTK